MSTDTVPAVTKVGESVDRLRADLDNVQRELDQALDVWRTALLTEKKEFQEVVQAKERAWADREREWHRQRAAYEDKIRELEERFRAQMATADQNALRALNELDDAWQRDKLSWAHVAQQRVRELEAREAQWLAENERREQALRELQAKVDAQAGAAESAQAVREARDEDLHTREAAWNHERHQREQLIQRLQLELAALQNGASTHDAQPEVSQESVERQLASLDAQVAFLQTAVEAILPSSPATPEPAAPESTAAAQDPRLKLIQMMDRNRAFR